MKLGAWLSIVLLTSLPAYAGHGHGHGGGSGCGVLGGAAQIDTLNSPGGSIRNGFGTWTFGPIVVPATLAGPPGPFGPYHFIALNGKVIHNLSSASAITLDCSGNMFFLASQNDRLWYQYVGYNFGLFNGSPFLDPTQVQYAPGPPATFNPPYTPSPDGTTFSGSGTLITIDGTWVLSGGAVTLNGRAMASPPPGGSVTDIEVASNGQFYAKAGGTWQVWLDFNWYAAGSSIPVGPIPIRVTVTVASPFYPGYAPSQCLATNVTTTTPLGIGTTVAVIAVTMSDGSPFSGSFTLLDGGGIGANVLAVYLSTLNLNAHPTIGGASFTVSATQNGVTTDAGASIIQVNVSS
jgi:hypothetical protein